MICNNGGLSQADLVQAVYKGPTPPSTDVLGNVYSAQNEQLLADEAGVYQSNNRHGKKARGKLGLNKRQNGNLNRSAVDVKDVIEKTLSSQGNCFLPNYKKNVMIRRFQQAGQILEISHDLGINKNSLFRKSVQEDGPDDL